MKETNRFSGNSYGITLLRIRVKVALDLRLGVAILRVQCLFRIHRGEYSLPPQKKN